ncbi:hypothetical protein GDO78_022395 [Eleutherodactylus coqui]|uniref:Uncharacterized protein n=1 Tax=Eleutherodactylus coqui TaxID=57060 RepID=A0A8J6EQN0_ELECQ|nr:hypothetical protein GDO78_022395 [Eleutherodactylus coqui]
MMVSNGWDAPFSKLCGRLSFPIFIVSCVYRVYVIEGITTHSGHPGVLKDHNWRQLTGNVRVNRNHTILSIANCSQPLKSFAFL